MQNHRTPLAVALIACLLFVACDEGNRGEPPPAPLFVSPTVTPIPVSTLPPGPRTERGVIIPGAAYVRETIRVLPGGGSRPPIELSVEAPITESGFQQGLMGAPPLPDTEGMLFVMARRGQCNFWMKDTPSPLSIAFVDEGGRIFAIRDMQPFSLDIIDPGRGCYYALEVAQGWFDRQGVRAGDLVQFPWPPGQPPPYPGP